jgi:hypothetical protein
MHIVMVQVGDGKGTKSFPLCQINVHDPITGMVRLRRLLANRDIVAEPEGNGLRWKDCLFSIQDVPREDALSQALAMVRAVRQREEDARLLLGNISTCGNPRCDTHYDERGRLREIPLPPRPPGEVIPKA